MRNWLSWIVGFAITFSVAVLALLVYSFARPSLWLPILFGVAFYGLLWFTPRLTQEMRVGLATLFGSISCILWMASSSDLLEGKQAALQSVFQAIMAVIGLIGLVISIDAFSKIQPKSRPRMSPIIGLILTGWLIAFFSSSHGAATPMIEWIMRTFSYDRDKAESTVLIIRKSIHFTFYGLVALTAFLTPLKNGAPRQIGVIAALLTTLAYATFDEVRQSTQPDRGGSAWDVALDMTGGSAALVVVSLITISRPGRGPKTARKSSTL